MREATRLGAQASAHRAAGPADAADLRRTCLHEYAHLSVARHFGACGFVSLRRIVSGGAAAPRYGGRFQMYGALDDDEWRIVALAGTVAELIDAEPALDAQALCSRLASGAAVLSDIDAQLAAGYTPADVRRCAALVRALWRTIDEQATEHAAGARDEETGARA